MANQKTESKRLLSYVVAEWACALKYEHLSREAIQAAKLFWFDSIGCALGGSKQDDAKILLKHYRAMSGETVAGGGDPGPTSPMPATTRALPNAVTQPAAPVGAPNPPRQVLDIARSRNRESGKR